MAREKPSVPLTNLDELMIRQFAKHEDVALLRNYLSCHFGPRIYRMARAAEWIRRKRAREAARG